MSTAITLIDVARASLCELRDDYITWLMDKDQPPWPHTSPEAKAIFAVRLDPAAFGGDTELVSRRLGGECECQ